MVTIIMFLEILFLGVNIDMKITRRIILFICLSVILFINRLKLNVLYNDIIIVLSTITLLFIIYTEKSFKKKSKVILIALYFLYLIIYFYYRFS